MCKNPFLQTVLKRLRFLYVYVRRRRKSGALPAAKASEEAFAVAAFVAACLRPVRNASLKSVSFLHIDRVNDFVEHIYDASVVADRKIPAVFAACSAYIRAGFSGCKIRIERRTVNSHPCKNINTLFHKTPAFVFIISEGRCSILKNFLYDVFAQITYVSSVNFPSEGMFYGCFII